MSVAVALAGMMMATESARADEFDALETSSDVELSDMRGGFMINGTQVSIGAQIRTLVDGAIALSTTVNWGAAGKQVIAEAGAGFRFGATSGPNAVSAVDPSGAIHVTHTTAPNDVVNLLVNSDSNRVFQQQSEFTITLQGFEATQSQFITDLLGMRLGADIANAITGRP